MKITQFTPSACEQVKQEVSDAIQSIAQKYGIKLACLRGSYTSENFLFKVEASVLGRRYPDDA